MLKNLLNEYAKKGKGPSMTALATQDMPKGCGKKTNKATQRRKGRGREKVTIVSLDYKPLLLLFTIIQLCCCFFNKAN